MLILFPPIKLRDEMTKNNWGGYKNKKILGFFFCTIKFTQVITYI